MHDFSYYNIFETKGPEYIIIILFLMILIPFCIFLNRNEHVKEKFKKAFRFLSFENLKLPMGIFYGKNHTWAFMEKTGSVSVGIDDFLLRATGAVKIKHHKHEEDFVNQGEMLAEIVNKDKGLMISSPVSVTILKTNSLTDANSELLYNDPYEPGWMYKMKPSN